MAKEKEDDCGLSSAFTQLAPEHYERLARLIRELPTSTTTDPADPKAALIPHYLADQALEQWKETLDLYQEQPHLLDAKLMPMLDKLLQHIREAYAEKGPKATVEDCLVRYVFHFLGHLCKVRGYKVMLRHLPHEVGDLQPAVALLSEVAVSDGRLWTQRLILSLWLLILLKMPFDLRRFDGSGALVETLLRLARLYAGSHEACGPIAARLLAALLTRHDLKGEHLEPALRKLIADVDAVKGASKADQFAVAGHLGVLATVLKAGGREELRPHAGWLLKDVMAMDHSRFASILLDKLRLKLLQRIGLLFLKPRLAPWRYRRGARSLAVNLGAVAASAPPTEEDDAEEETEVPEEVEEVIGQLIKGISHDEGLVRWSAAKGLGRVSARLPRALAEDVTDGIMGVCAPRAGEAAWHGGLLALAELGRRGALLPSQLGRLSALLQSALTFEESAGRFNVGGQVRDAGCFLAWSFARTFEPAEMGPWVLDLGTGLVRTALLDRELHCRRAASAAFQEHVGRQGSFPAGLEIIAACDYFAVGQLGNCYRSLVPFVAQFETYRRPLCEALINSKVPHWDPNIRKLAADALGSLTPLEPELMVAMTIEKLIPMAVGKDLFGRQGSLFAIGEIVSALLGLPEPWVTAPLVTSVSGLVGEMSRRGLVKGMGADWVRGGLNVLMGRLAAADAWRLPSLAVLKDWAALLHENLHNADKGIRGGAADVWASLGPQFRRLDPEGTYVSELHASYVAGLRGASAEVERQAGALWLGAVGLDLLGPERTGAALTSLAELSAPAGESDKSWAEARQDSLTALELRDKDDHRTFADVTFTALLKGCDDYTLDVRGDIGKVVRETAMMALQRFFLAATAEDRAAIPDFHDKFYRAVCKMVQQGCEKIDLTRRIATETVGRILKTGDKELLGKLPDPKLLSTVFLTKVERDRMAKGMPCSDSHSVKWMSAAEAFPRLAKLLDSRPYEYAALVGLVVSAGGLTESTMKAASKAIREHVEKQAAKEDTAALAHFFTLFSRVLQDHIGTERVVGPCLVVLDKLFVAGVLEPFAADPDAVPFLRNLLALTIQVSARKKAPAKVLAGTSVVVGLLQLAPESDVVAAATAQALRGLAHVYPRVRRGTAAKLYEALLTYGTLDNHSELALGLLVNTDWDRGLDELAETRKEIAARLNLPDPLPPQPKPVPVPEE